MPLLRILLFAILTTFHYVHGAVAPPAEEVRSVTHFSRLIIHGPFKVRLLKGDAPKVRILAEQAQLSNVLTQSREDYLEILFKEKPNIFRETNVELEITCRNLSTLNLRGGCELAAEAALTDDTLFIEQSGGSKLFLRKPLQLKQMHLTASGASTCAFNGRITKLTIDVSGAGEITAENLDLTNLYVKNSAAAKTTLSGKSANAEVILSGASAVKAQNLVVSEMKLKAHAGSSAHIHVTETLDVEAGSGSRVRYAGQPKNIHPNITSGGSLKPLGGGND